MDHCISLKMSRFLNVTDLTFAALKKRGGRGGVGNWCVVGVALLVG